MPTTESAERGGGRQGDASLSAVGTCSAVMQQLLADARLAAAAPSTVLIIGESGAGKEYVARFIHRESPRKSAPFVTLNCAAIAETLLESELFGHGRGAFTGAVQERVGLFEAAHRGTLFLDEIGEMPLGMQAKLLRVLQEKEVRRVGENRDRPIDVRVIVATNRDLASDVAERRFRQDLYYRIGVIELVVPPLRERPEDLPVLAETLLQRFAHQLKRSITGYTPDALERLLRYPWPGNVRELQNVIERACVLAKGSLIKVEDLPQPVRSGRSLAVARCRVLPLSDMVHDYIMETLERNDGDRDLTARQLRIGRATLFRKLRAYRRDPSTPLVSK